MSLTDDEVGVLVTKSIVSRYEWHIDKFCTVCKKIDESLFSPVFTTCSLKCIKWRLVLYPRGDGIENKDYMSLYLDYLGTEDITATYRFNLLDITNYTVLSQTQAVTGNFDTNSEPKGYSKFIRRTFVTDENKKLLVNDILKIVCDITFTPNSENFPSDTFKCDSFDDNIVPLYRMREFDDLEKLLETGHHSDIIFKIGEEKFKAHKAIITSRSSVFRAMFDHDMKENKKNEIEITDVKPEVMKEMLRFIYVSRVIGIEKIACDLLQAAEKYSILELKILCEKSLYEDLKIENAFEYLKIADTYNTILLKSKVIEFIVKYRKTIVKDPAYKSFMILQSQLMSEVFHAMAINC